MSRNAASSTVQFDSDVGGGIDIGLWLLLLLLLSSLLDEDDMLLLLLLFLFDRCDILEWAIERGLCMFLTYLLLFLWLTTLLL